MIEIIKLVTLIPIVFALKYHIVSRLVLHNTTLLCSKRIFSSLKEMLCYSPSRSILHDTQMFYSACIEINMISPCVLVICTRLIVTFDMSIYITRCYYLFYFKLTSHDGVARVDLHDIRTCSINRSFCFIYKVFFYHYFARFLINDFHIRGHFCIGAYG